jgi:hypothetical protein
MTPLTFRNSVTVRGNVIVCQTGEIFMISGDLSFADVEQGPGDFHFSPAGSAHAAHRTRAGCRCIIIQAM